jgi:hypothetical protein
MPATAALHVCGNTAKGEGKRFRHGAVTFQKRARYRHVKRYRNVSETGQIQIQIQIQIQRQIQR